MPLADPEIVVQKLIQQALPSVTVATLIPMTLPDPFVLVREVPGQEEEGRGLFGRALIDVHAWSGGANAKTSARGLLVSVASALRTAWLEQTVISGVGYIGGRLTATDPTLLMDGTEPHNTFRYQARFSFITRPI